QRLRRHLRSVVAPRPRSRFGREERARFFLVLAREVAQREVTLGSAGELSAALAHHALGPQRGGALLATRLQRRRDVQRELVRGRVGDEQREQALGGERVRFVRIAELQVLLAGLAQAAVRERFFSVGERARTLERQHQLFVGSRRRRQAPRRE